MNHNKLNIAFFGSSLVSAYWNGAATYYRGIIKQLHLLGHDITFYEPDAFSRQENRDMDDPDWAKVVVYSASMDALNECLNEATSADILIKASGVGVFDEYLEKEVLRRRQAHQYIIFWDVDAPVTLERLHHNSQDEFHKLIPRYDLILTYGGGAPVENSYKALGAKECISIYNAMDPETHHETSANSDYSCSLAFLGNRLPDREERVNEFFFKPARFLKVDTFILGGSGWEQDDLPENVRHIGHVSTRDHNQFNSSPLAVLNISRNSMASYGFSPATRVFEAAGAGACIITDDWRGIDQFFTPGKEILVAKNGDEVIQLMQNLSKENSRAIGQAAKKRVLRDHTYGNRANTLNQVFSNVLPDKITSI
jgi:spore maturation protein CgeB